jgi:hypothetical protein
VAQASAKFARGMLAIAISTMIWDAVVLIVLMLRG